MAKNHSTGKKIVSTFKKNEYRRFIKKLGMGHTLPKLEKQKYFWNYMEKRHTTIDFLQDDFDMPPHILKKITDAFQYFFTTNEVGEKHPYPSLTIYEAFILSRSLVFTIMSLFSKDSKIRKVFNPLLDTIQLPSSQDAASYQVTTVVHWATAIYSSLESYSYGYDMIYKEGVTSKDIPSHFRFMILRKKIPVHQFSFENRKRFAYKLMLNKGHNYFHKEEMVWRGKSYKVYIQAHALRRLEERLHLDTRITHIKFLSSVQFDLPREFQGSVLIPVISSDKKQHRVGYFLCAFTKTVCVLKTFLFISQNGTPEGEKLNEQLAINKIDKEYLELDKLHHFTQSDIKSDTTLRPIFESCQLDHLFEIKEESDRHPDFLENATFIKEMLQLN